MLAEMQDLQLVPVVPRGQFNLSPDSAWTPDLVRGQLKEAIRLVQRIGGRVGPKTYGNSMPAHLVEWADMLAQVETGELHKDGNRIRLGATSRQVTDMESALSWPGRYCASEPGPLGVLNIWLRSVAQRVPFSRACKAAGIPVSTAKRARSRALTLIAIGLTHDGVPSQ